ncbi:MAG: ABC transporter ATP-binding protein [Actinomycetota bacterium]|jgi:putative ABC transport system ATP-binding protein
MTEPLLEAVDVARTYRGPTDIPAVRGVSLALRPGDLVALLGPSGSGKSTFLGMLAGLDEPDEGEVRWQGRPFATMSAEDRRAVHQREIGIVFQAYGLLPSLSAVENVALPLRVRGEVRQSREAATAMLERLDLRDRLEHRTFELSGGQQQRIAVARALVGQPTVVLADEPISEVDEANGERILAALWEVASRGGAVVVATHDPQAIDYATRAMLLRDGRVEAEGDPAELRASLTTD